jgi:hypothetical protein
MVKDEARWLNEQAAVNLQSRELPARTSHLDDGVPQELVPAAVCGVEVGRRPRKPEEEGVARVGVGDGKGGVRQQLARGGDVAGGATAGLGVGFAFVLCVWGGVMG